MISVSFRPVRLQKRYPITISRGTSTHTDNLYVLASDGEHVGIGEMAPSTGSPWTAENGATQLRLLASDGLEGLSIAEVYASMRERNVEPPAMAALDVALWDLFGKQVGVPLYRLFGLPKPTVATSVTIGIETPEVICERVPKILERTGAKFLKIKLGSPKGVDVDRQNFEAAAAAAKPFGVGLRVDANGGWDLATARSMLRWLAERDVEYVEQPLVEGAEGSLPELFRDRPLPIFCDESCRFASDIPRLTECVDGVNLKLMKCGGLTEALRIVATARAHGLQTMIGCMSESSIAISAGAHIGALFDHIDLDSHLNLDPDPATGAILNSSGIVMPSDMPGHGGTPIDA